MSSVQEVKAGIAAAGEHGDTAAAQIAAALDSADKMLALLAAAGLGTQHPKFVEALAVVNQAKQRLVEAGQLIRAAGTASKDYMGMLG